MPPLRLYVFAGVVFFAVMAMTNGGPMRLAVSSEGGRRIAFGGGIATVGSGPMDDSAPEPEEGDGSSFERWFDERVERAGGDPGAFNAAVIDAISYVHFLALPLFALILKLFWRRRYYVEHLVLGLHFHAVALLTGALLVGAFTLAELDPDGPAARTAMGVWWLGLAAYLYAALHRVYGGRWWATGLRVVGIGYAYLLVSSVVLAGAALVAMLRF